MDGKELLRALCIKYEGVYLKPYICPAGVPTIGIGSTRYENGVRVSMRDPAITLDRAYVLFDHHVSVEVEPALRRLAPVPLTQGQWAALADFIYNMGSGAFASSTLRRRVLAGEWEDVPTQLRKWIYGGGVQLTGLKRRRESEIECLTL